MSVGLKSKMLSPSLCATVDPTNRITENTCGRYEDVKC
jgi:hypothetical protein